MKPQGDDKYPDSGKPFRSQRFGDVKSGVLVNNRLTLSVRRGTWRLVALDYTGNSSGVFFVIGGDDWLKYFPVGVAWNTANAEYLSVSGPSAGTGGVFPAALSAVEVDVLDGEYIHFWGVTSGQSIKYVQVGELPPRDPEVSDRER